MNRSVGAILIVFFISLSAYSQTEFFNKREGFSLNYVHAYMNRNADAFSLTFHTQKGFEIGGGYNEYSYLSIGQLLEPKWEDSFPLKPYFGLSGLISSDMRALSPIMVLNQCFFINSDFPFSLQGGVGLMYSWQRDLNMSSSGDNEKWDKKHISFYGIGFTQSFFAKSNIVPTLGFSYNHADEENFLTIGFGVNISIN